MGTGRFSCSGSLKPALRGTDLRFFAGNKAARSLFRGGVRRCITVGISDEIPVLPSRLDFRGGGCDLGVTDNILPGGFLFLPFVSERRVYRGVTGEFSDRIPSAAPFFFGDGPTANTSLHTKVSPGGRFRPRLFLRQAHEKSGFPEETAFYRFRCFVYSLSGETLT